MSTDNSTIVKEIFESTKYMIDASLEKAPFDKTISGVILGASTKQKYYQVSIKGKTYTLPSHINNTLKPNTPVNVMVPQNNMDLAFIYAILGGEEKGGGGGSVTHADTADYATQAGYAETVKIATDKLVGGVLSSSGTDKVSVDPNTGVMTVGKVSNAINADNAHHADTAEDVINVPIASSTFVGGIKSSTGPGHVQVDENGIATVPDAGGIKEVPVATETEIGGILSGTTSGSVAVDESGNTSVNDVVTMNKTAKITVPVEFGEGPWTIEMDGEDDPEFAGNKLQNIIENHITVSQGSVDSSSFIITNNYCTEFGIFLCGLTVGELTITFSGYNYIVPIRASITLFGTSPMMQSIDLFSITGSCTLTVLSGYTYAYISFSLPGNPFKPIIQTN